MIRDQDRFSDIERIKKMMEHRGIDIKQLAKLVGAQVTTVQGWLDGENAPMGKHLSNLQNLMSYDLFGEEFTYEKLGNTNDK
jgi:DNA-binding transcriptional regulator YiaG